MDTWEYLCVTCEMRAQPGLWMANWIEDGKAKSKLRSMDGILNDFGTQGWELVTLNMVVGQPLAVFKRRKP